MSCDNEFIQQDIQLFYSTKPQSAINTPITDGAEFATALVDAFPAVFPTAETVDDADQVGDGASFPRFVRLYRWGMTFTLGMRLNTELALVLISRALGGTTQDTTVTSGVYDHLTKAQKTSTEGRCPPFTTFIMPNVGGANFLIADIAVNSFTIQQTGDAQPTASFNLMGTGYHIRPHGVVGLPDPDTKTPTHHYFNGAALGFTLDNGTTIEDLSSAGRVMSWSFEYNNNLILSRRVGDTFLVPGDVRTGSVAKNMTRGRQSATLNFRQTLDNDLEEYDWLRTNQAIHDITIKNVGDPINPPDLTYSWELEIQIPHGQLQTLTGSSEGDLLTVDDVIMALKDEDTGEFVNVRGRNTVAKLTSSASASPSGSTSPSGSASASHSPSASGSPSGSASPSASSSA